MRIFIAISLYLLGFAFAAQTKDMTTGDWRSVTRTNNNGTIVVEKESLKLRPDHTCSVTIDVSLQKGEHYIKDLQISASGIWKRYRTTLVVVIQRIDVPFAKEVSSTIDQRSLSKLAAVYKQRFETDPITINTIEFLDEKRMRILNEKGIRTTYEKYGEITVRPITPPKPVFVNEALRRQHR
jgi:hypothetical protein